MTCFKGLLRLHKVPSHEDPSFATDPLAEWATRENGLVDQAAVQINAERPAWFWQIWTPFAASWRRQTDLVTNFIWPLLSLTCPRQKSE